MQNEKEKINKLNPEMMQNTSGGAYLKMVGRNNIATGVFDDNNKLIAAFLNGEDAGDYIQQAVSKKKKGFKSGEINMEGLVNNNP